jgi:hypothetical protein
VGVHLFFCQIAPIGYGFLGLLILWEEKFLDPKVSIVVGQFSEGMIPGSHLEHMPA